MSKNTVFIHTNDKQMLGAYLAKYLLERNSKNPERFDVKFIRLKDYKQLLSKEGKPFMRKGVETIWLNDDLQSFTPLRFLPPQLMEFKGKAIVIDPDVFALDDINKLFDLDMEGRGIVCRQVHPEDGREAYYATSVMLLDCEKLTHWDWNKRIEQMFNMEIDYRDWMSLYLEDPQNIGLIGEEWNSFDKLESHTKLLHNTARHTQPWKTGLPIDFISKKLKSIHQVRSRELVKYKIKRIFKPSARPPYSLYAKHPDNSQIKFFFDSLNSAIQENYISKKFVLSEIKKKNVRADLLDAAKAY